MKNKNPTKVIWHTLLPLFLASTMTFVVGSRGIRAQQELFLNLSFEAQNYAPVEYLRNARTLPIAGTELILGADVFSKSGATLSPIDPKQFLFRWFLGGVKIAEAKGQNELRYTVPKYSPESPLRFRIEVSNPNTGAIISQTALNVPVVEPRVLLHRAQNGKPSLASQTAFTDAPGASIDIIAKPYFFNVRNLGELTFSWFADDQLIAGTADRPEFITIRLPAGAVTKQFSLRIDNPQNPIEQAQVNFIVESR